MTKDERRNKVSAPDQNALKSVTLPRILLPVLIGTGVVGFLFYHQWDQVSFTTVSWSGITLVTLLVALLFLVARIGFYAARLQLLSDHYFSFFKCVQLIFIWEFSSAISPTNVGGSAVALFVISQEKIGAARTATIVIYTIVLDTLFFLTCVPIWILLFGSHILGPGRNTFTGFGGWEISLLIAYGLMLTYGSFFFYGLFYNPQSLQRFSLWISRIKWLRRYRSKFVALGRDITLTSKALSQKNWQYHLRAFLFTAGAWSCRFLLIIALIIGFARTVPLDLGSITELYARIQTMFIMMAVSPTPGGAGLAELLFGNLLTDFVPGSVSLIIATIWRSLAYYFFLIVGVIIIPQWLDSIIRQKRQRKKANLSDDTQ